MAGTGDRDTVEIADASGGAVRTDRSADTLADDPAAGHDHRTGAGTAAADRIDDPRAIEIAATTSTSTTTTALARSATWFLGLGPGLAAPCGPLGLNRPRGCARSGQRFLVIADAAAGTAGLREADACSECDRDQKGQQTNRDRTLKRDLHKQVLSIS